MRVTKRLKESIMMARELGFESLLVKKAGNWGVFSYVEIPFSVLLDYPCGREYDTGRIGTWLSKESRPSSKSIGYFEVICLAGKCRNTE